MHHICKTVLQFPSREELQRILVNHPSIPDPYAQDIRIMDVFAHTFADKKRTPIGIQLNVHLLLRANTDIIPTKYRKAVLNSFTKALTEIAIQYMSKQPSSSI